MNIARYEIIEQLGRGGMAKDREERFAGAAELGEAVGALRGAESPQLIAERPITGDRKTATRREVAATAGPGFWPACFCWTR